MAVAAPSWRNFQADDSDDEFEKSGEASFSGKTALLILIDTTPHMFAGWEDNKETPFLAAIKCCEAILRSKIISNPGDLVSIVLNGTEQAKNSGNFPSIYELQAFSTVKVDMIKQLIEMRDSEDYNDFPNKIGSSDTYSLTDLFWQAKMNFDTAKTQLFSKKIMYFTWEDNPHGSRPNLQTDATSKFKDLGSVELNIISFKEDFQFDKFYSKLTDDESSVILAKDLESLQKIVRMKQRLKRPISRSTLEILPGVKVGIGFYSFVRKALPPRALNINKRTNEVVERSVNVIRTDTGIPVLKSEERKMANVQGQTAVFSAQEMKEIKQIQEPGVRILGYYSARDFDSVIWYRSPGYFLYPDDERIKGSKDLLSTLLKRCHLLEKVVIVRYVLTRGKSAKLGVLIPSVPDETTPSVQSIFPQGFHLFPIPFSDEVRKLDMEDGAEATPELVEIMEKIVKKLTNKNFDILEVKNPALQQLWRKLEEDALDEKVDDPEELFDYTEPNEVLMRSRLSARPKDGGESLTDQLEQVATKVSRSFAKTKSSAPIKKRRIDIDMEARHGRLMGCSCALLREFLGERGVEIPKICGKRLLIQMVSKALGYETFI